MRSCDRFREYAYPTRLCWFAIPQASIQFALAGILRRFGYTRDGIAAPTTESLKSHRMPPSSSSPSSRILTTLVKPL